MSILSDRSIIQRCMPPSHVIFASRSQARPMDQLAWAGVTHELEYLEELESRNNAAALRDSHPVVSDFKPMIAPFFSRQVKTQRHQGIGLYKSAETERKIVSYGLSSFGYDVRLGNKFKIFTNVRNGTIDPLNPDPNCFVDHEGDFCIIPPNSYILGHTLETFDIPRDIMVVCVGKSTYARLAAITNVTPIEPGFKGEVVIEIANCSTLPLKVYANQGIAQFLFFKGDQECMVSYADKDGKYMNQTGITTARL